MSCVATKFSKEDRERIQRCAGIGLSYDMISSIFGCAKMTLTKYCQEELDRGKALRMEKVCGYLAQWIDEGDKASTFFYLKTQGEWRETNRTEVTGADGAPFQVVINVMNKALENKTKAIEE